MFGFAYSTLSRLGSTVCDGSIELHSLGVIHTCDGRDSGAAEIAVPQLPIIGCKTYLEAHGE